MVEYSVTCLLLVFQTAFRIGSSTKLDDRVFALEECKSQPVVYYMMSLYPNLYPVHALDDKVCNYQVIIKL